MTGHLGIVRSLFMDGYKLVSGGDAKKIMIWDYKVRVHGSLKFLLIIPVYFFCLFIICS